MADVLDWPQKHINDTAAPARTDLPPDPSHANPLISLVELSARLNEEALTRIPKRAARLLRRFRRRALPP